MNDQNSTLKIDKPVRRGYGRVSFVAIMDEIKAKVDEGYSLVRVYETFADRLDLGYTQFTKYVSRYISKADRYSNRAENAASDG